MGGTHASMDAAGPSISAQAAVLFIHTPIPDVAAIIAGTTCCGEVPA